MKQVLRARRAALLAGLGIAAGIASGGAHAQAYPDKPIRVVVGFTPKGATDLMVRAVQPGIAAALGQPVNVENLAGSTGGDATAAGARAPGDGYTLVAGNAFTIVIAPQLFGRAPHTLARDLVPVGLISSQPYVLAVHPSLPVDSLQSLVTQARARPGHFTFYSTGQGSVGQVAGELLKSAAGIELGQVVYKSGAVAREDMGMGLVGLSIEFPLAIAPELRGGRLRGLAVTGARRLELFPAIPTTEEAGLPAYRVANWTGLFASPGTPPAVIARLHAALRETLATKEVREQMVRFGADDSGTPTPADFAALVKADTERLGPIVKLPVPVTPR